MTACRALHDSSPLAYVAWRWCLHPALFPWVHLNRRTSHSQTLHCMCALSWGFWLPCRFRWSEQRSECLLTILRLSMAVQKSKDCPYKFATKLPVPSGNATWHVPEKIPDSTIFIRTWLWNQQPDGTFKQANFGRTKTYLEVLSLPSTLLRRLSLHRPCLICDHEWRVLSVLAQL